MKIVGQGFFRYEVPNDYVPSLEWKKEIKEANKEMQKIITAGIDEEILGKLRKLKKRKKK